MKCQTGSIWIGPQIVSFDSHEIQNTNQLEHISIMASYTLLQQQFCGMTSLYIHVHGLNNVCVWVDQELVHDGEVDEDAVTSIGDAFDDHGVGLSGMKCCCWQQYKSRCCHSNGNMMGCCCTKVSIPMSLLQSSQCSLKHRHLVSCSSRCRVDLCTGSRSVTL